MTLLFTIVTYSKVVQVSDRRLTYPDGSLADDEANKAICVSCKDAAFAIAYTGLACLGRNLTKSDEWLSTYLSSIDAADKELIVISKSLSSKLTSTLGDTPIPQTNKNITFVLAGYWNGQPFIINISNWEKNQIFLMKPHIKSKIANAIMINGWGQAVDRVIHQRIKKLRRQRFFQIAEGATIAKELVSLIRASTRTQLSEGRIGRNCMSVVITPRSDYTKNYVMEFEYHPDRGSPVIYGPHLINFMGTFMDIEISTGDYK